MTPKQEAALRLALEALKLIDEAMPFPVAKFAQAALREALAEQPAQQEQKLPEFYARLEYDTPGGDVVVSVYQRQEDATPLLVHREALPNQQPAQQQKPDGRVISANCEYATVQWLHQTSNIGGGDPKNSRSWPIGGEDVYLSPPASKPWVWLDETDLSVCDTDGVRLARYWERVLREKNA